MLFAVVARCPHFGGKLQSFDASAVKAVPGVRAVFPIAPLGLLPKLERNINTAGGRRRSSQLDVVGHAGP